MNVLVLDGSSAEGPSAKALSEEILAKLEGGGHAPSLLRISEKDISPCRGCFGCWVSRPGECVIDDDGREMNRLFVENDVVILIGPLFHGSHSSPVKRVLDRSLPLLQPFFRRVDGMVRHHMRYRPMPDLLFIGVLGSKDAGQEDIFKEMVSSNAVNYGAPRHRALFAYDGDLGEVAEEAASFVAGGSAP